MKFSVPPTTPVTHAANFGCVVVDLENPTSSDPVTLSIGTNPSMGVLSGTLTVNAVDGVAVFGPLQISLAGNGFTLVATAPLQRNGLANFPPFGAFQPGYYYNYPSSGAAAYPPANTVEGEFFAGNILRTPVMFSVTSAPFNVV